jgi:nucleotide-binding universal stress UspA family protein
VIAFHHERQPRQAMSVVRQTAVDRPLGVVDPSKEQGMFKRVLVPLDGTPQSAAALPPARAVAVATGGTLRLLRVILPQVEGPDEPEPAATERSLARIAAELAPSGVPVETVVRQSDVTETAILDEVRASWADLLVMATHGRRGLQRTLQGSVTQYVLAESPVPILTMRPGGHRTTHLSTLLVPVDGSPGAAIALGLAVPLARAIQGRLVLLQVMPVVLYGLGDVYTIPGAMSPSWDDEPLAGPQTYAERFAGRLQRSGIEASGRSVLGHAAETIVETANDVAADLIVMSTHARTGPSRAILGSTAEAVVRTARRPVLLVRQRAHCS